VRVPKGVLVCPKIRKFGLMLGTEGGECVLFDNNNNTQFYNARELKFGLVIGWQSHSLIVVLNSDEVMTEFSHGKREWEFGVDASILVYKLGMGADIDTNNIRSSIITFISGEQGFMADLSWEGGYFRKLVVK